MKSLFRNTASALLIALLVWSLGIFNFSQPASAGDVEAGAKLFKANCVGCHLNGNNTVQKEKTLKIDALKANDKYSLEAIVAQVKNGKNAMPAFSKKLKAAEIENVASYVLAQADNGWKKSK